MSDVRFALLTTAILVLSYTVALTVVSLERVLAYVGSTGSTSISFILPGLFYYKISDPDSIHHQRLAKADDDATSPLASDDEDEDEDGSLEEPNALPSGANARNPPHSALPRKTASISKRFWRYWRKWRWDMEHVNHAYLRKAALGLAIYGMIVMVTCLVLNAFVSVAH
jgi:hypothetical protein